MPRLEPRFYDCPGRSVMTLLTAVPRTFTTAEELNKKCDIHMILLVCVCVCDTAGANSLRITVISICLVCSRELRITIVTETSAWWSYSAGGTRMSCTK